MINENEIKILLINLEQSTDRLDFQKLQFDKLGIPWTLLTAVSTDNIPDNIYESLANNWERKLRKTEVACFLSHKKAWEHIIEINQPMLVLEDDALLATHTKQLIQDIVKINSTKPIDHVCLEIRNRKKLLDKHKQKINDYFDITRMYQDRSGSAAYLIFPSGAQKLLNKTNALPAAPADAFINNSYSLFSYQVLPAAAIQVDQCAIYNIAVNNTFPSTISKGLKDKPETVFGTKKIIFKYRRIIGQINMAFHFISVLHKSNRTFVMPKKEDFLP